jgi:hypothetical protein
MESTHDIEFSSLYLIRLVLSVCASCTMRATVAASPRRVASKR